MSDFGINFSALVYSPAMDTYAVPVTFSPINSLPGAGAYQGRGILSTRELNVLAEDNSIYSDQQTILDILEAEFAPLPAQGDIVTIPRDCNGVDQGSWEVISTSTNGGGQTTLTLRKWK